MVKFSRGDICLANLNPVIGSEQGGFRPVLVLQNDIYNNHSPVVVIAAITSKIFSKEYPTNVSLSIKESKLDKNSTVLLNQIRTIDKIRIRKRISNLSKETMWRINLAIKVCLDLN